MEPLEVRLALSGFGPADGAYIVEPWIGDYEDVQIQPGDQKIVAAGSANSNMAIARYDSLGNPDNSYGTGGPSIPPLSGVSAPALGSTTNAGGNDLVLQPDGKAVVAGNISQDSAWAVARFNTDGSLDGSFGSGGWSSLDVRALDFNPAIGAGLQSTGKVVVAGLSMGTAIGNNGTYNPAEVARFTAAGAIDSGKGAFGDVVQGKALGYALTTFGMPHNAFHDLAVQPDDKLVAVGLAYTDGTSRRLIVARYTASGTLDKTFNGNGYFVFLPSGISDAVGNAVALQSDGKIVVTGSCTGTDGADDMLVARFNTNGTLDTSFGGGSGYVRLDNTTAAQSGEYVHDVAIQLDGKIVVAGPTSVAGNPSNVMVARFNVDGTPDATFAPGGYKIGAPLPTTGYHSFTAAGVALQSDGSIIVAGFDDQVATTPGVFHPLLMRFFPTSSNSLMAAGGSSAVSTGNAPSFVKVQPLLTAAIARGQATEVTISGLGSLNVPVSNLPDATPDLASGNAISLDSGAAAWDWLVHRSSRPGHGPRPVAWTDSRP
jgi:uncharacterized delta-60 repeat protein